MLGYLGRIRSQAVVVHEMTELRSTIAACACAEPFSPHGGSPELCVPFRRSTATSTARWAETASYVDGAKTPRVLEPKPKADASPQPNSPPRPRAAAAGLHRRTSLDLSMDSWLDVLCDTFNGLATCSLLLRIDVRRSHARWLLSLRAHVPASTSAACAHFESLSAFGTGLGTASQTAYQVMRSIESYLLVPMKLRCVTALPAPIGRSLPLVSCFGLLPTFQPVLAVAYSLHQGVQSKRVSTGWKTTHRSSAGYDLWGDGTGGRSAEHVPEGCATLSPDVSIMWRATE